MKITKKQLREMIREERQKIIEENFLTDLATSAYDKVSDFFRGDGNRTVRGIDPVKASQNLKNAMIQFIASDMQEAGEDNEGVDYQMVVDRAIQKAQVMLDGIESEFEVEVQKER